MMLTMPTTFRAEPTIPLPNSDEAWRAVERRDPRFDGRFVYAVRSTRIYCRPSCPSRRPSRERVTFYAAPTAAEDAGYRACRRCHPREVHLGAAPAGARGRALRPTEQYPHGAGAPAALAAGVGHGALHPPPPLQTQPRTSP